MSGPTVLCVDPDESDRATTLERLRARVEGASVVPADSLAAAVDALRDRDVDCVVTEYALPDGTGLELASRVRDATPDTGCVLYTAADRDEVAADAPESVVVEYVDKAAPDPGAQLARIVDAAATLRTQTAYPLPQDESERLAALDAYDLEAETLQTDLERLADLAATHFGAFTASVNIIGEREQEFLTCHGVDWSPIPREESICTYAIVDDSEVTVVEDVGGDPRFEDNETLRELGIRAYMGADLPTADEPSIGTLCVYFDEPRRFDTDDEAYLLTLAEVAVSLLDLHREAERGSDDANATPTGGDSA